MAFLVQCWPWRECECCWAVGPASCDPPVAPMLPVVVLQGATGLELVGAQQACNVARLQRTASAGPGWHAAVQPAPGLADITGSCNVLVSLNYDLRAWQAVAVLLLPCWF